MRKRVLIIANCSGGLYNFRKELVEELINRKYEVYISAPIADYTAFFEQMGCTCINTSVDSRGTNLLTDMKLVGCYKKLMKNITPDVVLSYTIKPNIYGGIVARRLKIPQIANITGLGTVIENGGLSGKLIALLYKYGLKKTKKVFFQNQSNMDFCRDKGIVGSNCDLLPGSGVNLNKHCFEEYPENTDEISFITVGRIMKSKGTDELLETARIIKSKHKNVRFKLVGYYDGDYEDKINKAVNEGIIEFYGRQNDVHPFNKESHASLLPSYHEGMANVLLESAATGRPILSTDVPGCRETFEPYVTGIPFKAKSVDDMVRAIEEFLAMSYEERKAMGIAGRKKVEKQFDRQIVIDKYLKTIEKEVN